MRRALIPLLVSLAQAVPAAAEIIGPARVIDGDTLEIEGTRVRLFGIDAPETHQLCERSGRSYRCGEQAARVLAEWLGAQPVSCRKRTTDRYGRIVAVCFRDDEDVGAWLVRAGWALSFRKYSAAYLADEDAARRQHRGLWQGEFAPPWEWREWRSHGARSAPTP